MVRSVTHRYEDPLDRIWLRTAEAIGLRVKRTSDAYATSDGRGSLHIGSHATLDADDSLAQMIFHELCHSLVEGSASFRIPDWGLDNQTPRDVAREHACLRTQAALAREHGLRTFFATTTDYRSYYDAIPDDPLDDARDEPVRLARIAVARARREPWAPHLHRALETTGTIARATRDATHLREGADSLFGTVLDPPLRHIVGTLRTDDSTKTCGGCAWWSSSRGRSGTCRAFGKRVSTNEQACANWEALDSLDCRACGACCREGYDAVWFGKRERIGKTRPELVVVGAHGGEMKRSGGRCIALQGDGSHEHRFTCIAYEERPSACRDLEPGSDGCLTARRRTGLSR